jgi:1,4-dihydroxy-2-naphthoate octaprenyltransferase
MTALKPWFLAARPKTLTASLIPIVLATALAYRVWEGPAAFPIWISILALLSALCIQIATNLINDALDFKKGADTEKRLGPKRATQMGWLTPGQVLGGGLVFFLLAIVFGIPLVLQGGLPIVALGAVSILCGYLYTGGPYPLAYKGLGDVFVMLFFGLAAVLGVYYLYHNTLSWAALVVGLQVGFFATALLAVNNARDFEGDRTVGKMTLAARFGLNFARKEILFCYVMAYLLMIFWLWHLPFWSVLLPLVASFPMVAVVLNIVHHNQPSPIYNKALGLAALAQLGFGVVFGVMLCL